MATPSLPSTIDPRRCQWCTVELGLKRRDQKFCTKRCRQTAWRFRGLAVARGSDDTPLRLAYADPPYPGCAHYYRGHPDYRGEVCLAQLLATLRTYDGWALSSSPRGLIESRLGEEKGVHVCPWVKTHHQPRAWGPANVWEVLIVKPARVRLPGPRDALVASVARGGDDRLIGRKPLAFCAWMFELLGASPVDRFDDLFPGTGTVKRCWDEWCRSAGNDASPAAANDASLLEQATPGA